MDMMVVEQTDEISHVALSGKLDVAGVGRIEMKFLAATAHRKVPAIVDMSQVDFTASLGMGMLLGAAKALGREGHRMVLYDPQELVEMALKTGRIDEVIPIMHGVHKARALALGEEEPAA